MVYHILVFLLGLVPVNKDFKNTHGGVEVYVGTNGIHTDIYMPVQNEIHDWRQIIPLKHFPQEVTTHTYISMGWGDKGFYINTPTWSDLTIPTAFKALFLASETAMHVTYFPAAPRESDRYVKIILSEKQYQKLIKYILPYFQKREDGSTILIIGVGYSYKDNFYEAHDTYHFLNTSNTWTNRALRKTGVRTALWSPLDKSIMHQLRKIKN
ncbi:MAG: TIGR02117 family protein [Bacteroidota bacterium]|nr:TIGR02117 family protein [Bacteroidota bacterium]